MALAAAMSAPATPRLPALEEAATGQSNQEREMVFYAKLAEGSDEVLKAAQHREHHEQWELRVEKADDNAAGGRFRVRRTTAVGTDNHAVEYVLTSKTKLSDGSGENEVSVPSSEDQFNQFKLMSPRGMIKTRYTFDIPGRPDKWEVDTFVDQKGDPSAWVKIDLEITDGNFTRPPFPPGLIDEMTVMTNAMKSIEISQRIRQLYDEVFITPNQVTLAAKNPSDGPEVPIEANPAPPLSDKQEPTEAVTA